MKTDARALDHATLTDLRKRGVAAVQSGEDPAHVAEVLGVNIRTVFRWLARYRRGGWSKLDARKRGGRPPKLDGSALKSIYQTVANKNPQELQISFADEAGVRSDYHSGTTWRKRGTTPDVSGTGARFGVNLISAISAQGELRFMLTKGRVTAGMFIEFLRRLLVNASKPIFVIADRHPTHIAKSVARFVASQAGNLALFFLPPSICQDTTCS